MEARQDIIQATEQEYVKLRAAIDGLGEAQMSEVWLGSYDDFDRWNARFVDARKDVATDDVLREADRSHRDFVRAASRLSPADLAAGQAAHGLIEGVGAAHYREHAAQILDWRSRAGR